MRMLHTVPLRSIPSGLLAPHNDNIAVATASVGKTKGTRVNARNSPRPGNAYRANT